MGQRRLTARAASLVCATAILAWPLPEARAEAAPDEARTPAYYGVNGGLTLAFAGSALLLASFPPIEASGDPEWFPGDRSLRGRYVPAAAAVSDFTLAATVLGPLGASAALGFDYALANRTLVYTQTLAADVALTALAKWTFARPRPLTYGGPEFTNQPDSYVSFFSGHSSLSFAAAVSGSYLFAEAEPDRAFRVAMWASELTLASATATLRIRAGKHYYSDVIVGAIAGTLLGVAIPFAHGGRYQPEPLEYLGGAAGILVGATAAALVPLPHPPARSGPLPPPPGPARETGASWTFAPWAGARSSLGIQAAGTF